MNFFEVDIDYPKKLFDLHKDLPFLPENKKENKAKKTYLQRGRQRKICYAYRSFKTSLKSWISIRKVHREIHFNQKDQLKPYIDMNTNLRKKAKNDFEKDFFKLINNSVFGKTMENVRKHRDIKSATKMKK